MISILAAKPTAKKPLGRPMRRWEDNIRIYLREKLSIQAMAQDMDYWIALVNAALNLRVLKQSRRNKHF